MISANLPRVGVIGAGAIGCTLAARFAHAGCEVRLAARGDAADIIRRDGVHLTAPGLDITERVVVVDTVHELQDLDYVFITVKQQDLKEAVLKWLPSLPGGVTVIPAINGIPWWFFSQQSEGDSLSRDSVISGQDLDLTTLLPDAQVVGSVVYLTAYSVTPGVVVQGTRNRLIVGELGGDESTRVMMLKEACLKAGMDCDVSSSIRLSVWVKAVGNAVFNPLSVLAGADMASMVSDTYISQLALSMLHECLELGRKLGLPIEMSAEERLRQAGSAGAVQTSMLQDYLKGKPLEVEALVGSLVRIGARMGVEMPFTNAVYGLVRSASLNNPFLSEKTEETRV